MYSFFTLVFQFKDKSSNFRLFSRREILIPWFVTEVEVGTETVWVRDSLQARFSKLIRRFNQIHHKKRSIFTSWKFKFFRLKFLVFLVKTVQTSRSSSNV